jgi:ABC-type molybdate transport system permease subunit
MKSARVQGHKLVDIIKDDPIVLQPVKEGYLIVSAWGIEASDKEVQNSKFN